MRLKWHFWRWLIRRFALKQGFIDPFALLARFESFAQPSEVGSPIELLRAGAVFHARGLLNTKAIQNNLDWIWPYWVQRQFDPRDPSFIPRSFSITHVNLTHRNWTAVGIPDCDEFPVVDPRGLLTPHFDGWSVDCFIVDDDGVVLSPARRKRASQKLLLEEERNAVRTRTSQAGLKLETTADATMENGPPETRLVAKAESDRPAWLVVSIRPFNPEGVSLVEKVSLARNRREWSVNGEPAVELDKPVDRHLVSDYRRSDVMHRLLERKERRGVKCQVGMATAAGLFRIEPGKALKVAASIPMRPDVARHTLFPAENPRTDWRENLDGLATLDVPDGKMQFLYDAAVRTLILHSPLDVYPGPYTYKRFWFRDAALILNAMLAVGMTRRAERMLDEFPSRQLMDGYFRSQEGEWDSNGEVLWIYKQFLDATGRRAKPAWRKAIRRGAKWIARKRLPDSLPDIHAGLLPAGFSAEHLGNNDYYYWDDYWGVAGLRAAAAMSRGWGAEDDARAFDEEARRFEAAIENSLKRSLSIRAIDAIPASPHRRMDAGAIGSIVCSYPLRLYTPRDRRLMNTVAFLREKCYIDGAFFQDMIHSGINVYLTLHVAQVLLRAGNPAFYPMVRRVMQLASPTGQWPEAIHQRVLGGCMGDGQHVWAAAEWILMIRNMFLREEEGELVIASGIVPEMLEKGKPLRFGPGLTRWGPVSVSIHPTGDEVKVAWDARWRGSPPSIRVALPGHEEISAKEGDTEARFSKVNSMTKEAAAKP